MLADPLTKLMKADRLIEALDTSTVDLTPTAASTIAKLMKQQQRRKTSTNDHDDNDVENDESGAGTHKLSQAWSASRPPAWLYCRTGY